MGLAAVRMLLDTAQGADAEMHHNHNHNHGQQTGI